MGLEDREVLLAWLEHRIEKADNEKSVFSRALDLAKIHDREEFVRIMQEELDRATRKAARAEIARRLIEKHHQKGC